jgi:hypothetical protein
LTVSKYIHIIKTRSKIQVHPIIENQVLLLYEPEAGLEAGAASEANRFSRRVNSGVYLVSVI